MQIELSKEDYDFLKEAIKELNEQEHDGQAHPRYWSPASDKPDINHHGEGDIIEIYRDCESQDPKSFAEYHEEFWIEFCEEVLEREDYDNVEYDKVENKWIEYLKDNEDEYDDSKWKVWTLDMKRSYDHNPSLFKSDVKRFVKSNKHHLGSDPGTYARSVWRMPKMERLINILYNLKFEEGDDKCSTKS